MLVKNSLAGVQPILKRHRSNSTSLGEHDAKRVALPNPETEKCALMLERVRETGLASSYASDLEDLAEAPAAQQVLWINHLTMNVILLDQSLSDFISKVLKLDWKLNESEELCQAFQNFNVALVTVHSRHCKNVFSQLFSMMNPVVEDSDHCRRVTPHVVPEKTARLAHCAINTIVTIHTKVPLSERSLLQQASKSRPYYRRHPHHLLVYFKCLLILSLRIPTLRRTFLELVIERMVDIDTNCPKEAVEDSGDEDEEVFKMEVDEHKEDRESVQRLEWILQNSLMHSLDVLIESMVLYIHCTAHGVAFTLDRDADLVRLQELGCIPGSVKVSSNGQDNGAQDDQRAEYKQELTRGCNCGGDKHDISMLRIIYNDLYSVFTKFILPTHSSAHIQFFMFYFLCMRPSLTRTFLESLRTDYFLNHAAALDVQKNALAYIGSLVVRGKFVPFSTALSCLEVIVTWCHEYISSQEREMNNNYMSLNLHQKFYSACQTVFYIFTFRCREFTKSEKTLEHVRRLKLERFVFCNLNPLAVCRSQIVSNFAAVTSHFQLTYCYAVLEKNKRNTLPVASDVGDGRMMSASITGTTLDMSFPFDPYQLVSTLHYFDSHYQDFPGLPDFIDTNSKDRLQQQPDEDNEEDDFLDQSVPSESQISYNVADFQFSPVTRR